MDEKAELDREDREEEEEDEDDRGDGSFVFFPRLRGVFFAEFHPTQGPKIVFQTPENLVAPEAFEVVSEFIIPKPPLCGRLVTICTSQYKIVGFPVRIENNKYERNALLFNLCMVFRSNADVRPYEQIVRRLAEVLLSLELESEFLHNAESKASVEALIEHLLEDLNSYRECQIPVGNGNSVNLRLFPVHAKPPEVFDYQVPISLVDLESVSKPDWDLGLQRIIRYVDGVHYVKLIAEKADMDIKIVRRLIQHLLYYGCIQMVDIFQFSNIYAVTEGIDRLYADAILQHECQEFVSREEGAGPNSSDIFRLYCAFGHNVTVGDVYRNHKVDGLNIDIRRFVLFGVVRGFLRRLHKYPFQAAVNVQQQPALRHPNGSYDEDDDLAHHAIPKSLQHLLTGTKCMDELCEKLSRSERELQHTLAAGRTNSQSSVSYILK